MLTGHRAKLAAAIRSAQDDVRRQLLPEGHSSSDLSKEARRRAHLSEIHFDSFETIDLEQKAPIERDALCGREWIEDHLDYTRRYRLTDKEVESAADFRRQNAKECVAPGSKDRLETILVMPADESAMSHSSSDCSDDDEGGDMAQNIGRESPNPGDMNDERIVDYTLNHRLFPVPLFPTQQETKAGDARYVRISIPKHTMVADFKPKIGRKPTDTEDSVSLWEHCVKGFNNHSYQKPQSKSKNKLDLRSHLNPYDAVDVYKIQSGQSFQLGPKKKDPFDISKVNFEERL